MKYIVTQRIDCVLTIPNGTQLEIDGFIFLRDIDGNNSAKYIQTEVDANTKEEAQSKARKLTAQFLSKITILHNAKYTLLGIISVTDGNTTTVSTDVSGRFNLGIDGNLVKDDYVKNVKNKRLRVRPLQHYSDGINSIDPFNQFRNFYFVLEYYLKNTNNITNWIKIKIPKIEMRKDMNGTDITIFSWIRHRLSHSYKKGGISPRKKKKITGLNPLSISKPEDVLLVQRHLPIIQNLAQEIIREYEKI